MGRFPVTGLEFDLTVLAALQAFIGYSIIGFDRVRENFRKLREKSVFGSINNYLTETLVTSLTTVLVLVALAVFGGDMIFGFAVALLVGVVVGT